ncbi:MAG: hypothetical protein EYC68_05895 [Chloroflexota bacterium]|nr:MAG: hypothetical protein EYC68_05895 [Chloroflexota bacterium]
MILQSKTLEKLRLLINEETQYRSGPKLVQFFNDLGFSDTYEQGFPSRWAYTDERLAKINGTPELAKCLKKVFSPVDFIGRFGELDKFLKDFNQYLAFDKWKIVRNGAEINFIRLDQIEFDESTPAPNEDEFLKREFEEVALENIGLDEIITEVLRLRVVEIEKCLSNDAPLSVIFLAGSTLEGVLLGIALRYPKEFNQSKSSPKDKEGKVKQYPDWTLSNFIDVAHEVGLLAEDVKNYSHTLRDFRNYIHPYQQLSSKFNPNKHTAKISWQVLKAALFQLSVNKISSGTI